MLNSSGGGLLETADRQRQSSVEVGRRLRAVLVIEPKTSTGMFWYVDFGITRRYCYRLTIMHWKRQPASSAKTDKGLRTAILLVSPDPYSTVSYGYRLFAGFCLRWSHDTPRKPRCKAQPISPDKRLQILTAKILYKARFSSTSVRNTIKLVLPVHLNNL